MNERAGDSRFGLPADPEADEELARTMEAIREAERAGEGQAATAAQTHDDAVCCWTWCDNPQGVGTWTSINGETLPVCEDHWFGNLDGEIRKLRTALTHIVELHQPTDEEVEVWIDDENPSLHAEHFADCTGGCEGHALPIKVCRECGHDHNGEFPTFRLWPCPTMQALAEVIA